jgi:hypothetical protein
MEQQYSIQNTKESLIFAFTLAEVIKEAKANDGKIDIMDLPLLMKIFPVLSPAMADINLVPKELGELSVEEASELQAEVLSRFGKLVEKEKLVEQVNLGLKAAIAVYAFARALK